MFHARIRPEPGTELTLDTTSNPIKESKRSRAKLPTVDTDVLVVGAGPIGMTLAHGLHLQGVDVLLVEKSARIAAAFKGEYIQPAGVRILNSVGLDPTIGSKSANFVRELRFRDLDRGDAVVSDLLMSYGQGRSALAINHFDLLTSLRSQVERSLGDRIWTGVTVRPDGSSEAAPEISSDRRFLQHPVVIAERLNGTKVRIRAKYIVGCDGRGSTVRSWMGGPRVPANASVIMGARREWIVGAEIKTLAPKPERYEVFRSYTQGTLSAFSLGEHGQRLYMSSLESASNKQAHTRLQVEELLLRVHDHAPLGRLEPQAKILSFPAYTRWFGPVQKGHLILAGDACSVTTPYGGQGLAAGLEAVENLLSWLPECVRSRYTRSALVAPYSYALQTRSTFYRHSLLNLGLYYIFFSRAPAFKHVTGHILRSWDRNPDSAQRVMNLFGGIDRDIPSLPELTELWGLREWPPNFVSAGLPIQMANVKRKTGPALRRQA